MKKILITGGAGFIGSCLISMLNARGINNIIIVDNINGSEKWLNISDKKFIYYINKKELFDKIKKFDEIDTIIHLGACSSTVETDFDYLWKNNTEYTMSIWQYCLENNIRMIYASSAATYGNPFKGIGNRKNRYAFSKNYFDDWVVRQENKIRQCVGLKFFNVYGPNEYFKGKMSSMIYQGFQNIYKYGEISLFQIKDNNECEEIKRDFIYVKDVCNVILYMLDNPDINGIFDVGTGIENSFTKMAQYIFRELEIEEKIKYIEIPNNIRRTYQYYTKADTSMLRKAGYICEFTNLKDGIIEYLHDYLMKDNKIM